MYLFAGSCGTLVTCVTLCCIAVTKVAHLLLSNVSLIACAPAEDVALIRELCRW